MSMKLLIATAAALAVLAGPALARGHAIPKGAHAQAPGADASIINGSRGAPEQISGARTGFAGYPTDYLTNRFGDRQMQGR
jgi:hypothetical protein